MSGLDDGMENLHISSAPAPPPPPGPGFGMPSYKEQREKTFEEQQMANLPSGLLTTAAKADKKPFSYTPVGLAAVDLKAPSALRQQKLEAIASGEDVPSAGFQPGIPRGPTNVRIFNGITPPSPMTDSSGRASPSIMAKSSPSMGRRPSLTRSDSGSGGGSVKAAPIQSRSFKILQWMTGADEDDDAIMNSTPEPKAPKAEPDEMRFTGYNRSDSIPSRAYQNLEKITSAASPSPNAENQPFRQERFRTEFDEETGANARYAGQAIPSRSFHALQNMTEGGGRLNVLPPSPTLGRRSPAAAHVNPALTQQHYGRQSPVNIPPPSSHDFRYQGPQYSTYDLPPKQNYNNYSPSPAVINQPRFSSSVSLVPGGGDHRSPQDYADQSSAYNPTNPFNQNLNYGYGGSNQSHSPQPHSPYGQPQAAPVYSQQQYGGGNTYRQAQPMAHHVSGPGRSDF